jgi:hypothetical protein
MALADSAAPEAWIPKRAPLLRVQALLLSWEKARAERAREPPRLWRTLTPPLRSSPDVRRCCARRNFSRENKPAPSAPRSRVGLGRMHSPKAPESPPIHSLFAQKVY